MNGWKDEHVKEAKVRIDHFSCLILDVWPREQKLFYGAQNFSMTGLKLFKDQKRTVSFVTLDDAKRWFSVCELNISGE